MPRGGRRQGKPGATYPNRTDLPAAPDPGAGTFKGQPYGAAQSQARVQAATPPPPGMATPGLPAGGPPGPAPGSFGAFNRPTERPNEPITHGLPTGPGGGPEVLGNPAVSDPATIQLRALYQKFPNQELADLLTDSASNRPH